MASTQTSYLNKNVGTVAQTITTATATTAIVGIQAANVNISPVAIDVYVTRSSVDYYLIKGATVPVGGTLVIAGGQVKQFIVNGDILKTVCSVANGVDVMTSVAIGI